MENVGKPPSSPRRHVSNASLPSLPALPTFPSARSRLINANYANPNPICFEHNP